MVSGYNVNLQITTKRFDLCNSTFSIQLYFSLLEKFSKFKENMRE